MALGARRSNILADVLLQGLTIAAVGVGAGILFGVVFSHTINSFVSVVHLPGLVTMIVSSAVILAAAVIASIVPAARAARVNAIEALRSE